MGIVDDPGFVINPLWAAVQLLGFVALVVVVVWVARFVLRSRR
jgi:hypothetical protein